VWYLAAGYRLPAGIEAYLLHYAAELRNHGFDTRIVVFQPLPREKHRYLRALEERGIPIESLDAACRWTALALWAVQVLPWCLYTLLARRRRPRPAHLLQWTAKRCAVRLLARRLSRERPDLVHVKGRILAEAWSVLPPERTVYQHALSGTVDPSWEPEELAAFRDFANRCARIFVQGRGIAATMARAYGITRPMDVVFTMAPDEAKRDEGGDPSQRSEVGGQRSEVREQRIEDGGQRTEGPGTPDPEPGTSNLEPRTTNHELGTPLLRFGILCRFTEQKGISLILQALKQYRDRHGDVDFTFAGQGEEEETIRRFVEREGLRNVRIERVTTPGDTLRKLDVFVHPGLDDAMPVSIVEALMFSVPVVATRVGGVPDLIRDGVEGWLIEPGSAAAILAAMEHVAALPPGELAAFRRCARARYEDACTPSVVGAQVSGIYREVLRGQRTDDGGQRTDDGGRKTDDGGERTEDELHKRNRLQA
jgi:glycosyltransferase involved in cell wall biosynthesis